MNSVEKRRATREENRKRKIDLFAWPYKIICSECGVLAFAIDTAAHDSGCELAKELRRGTILGRFQREDVRE